MNIVGATIKDCPDLGGKSNDMSESYEAIDGEDESGSLNHSTVQVNIGGELSLDISQYDLSEYDLGVKEEFKPDVCAYLKRPVVPKGKSDLVKISQMPDLAIEILSPRQAVDYLVRKINAYFELGVKSCWLVIPSLDEVRVFSQPRSYKSFDLNNIEIVDDVMEIHLPIANVFAE